MVEANVTTARLISINPGGMMSTIWEFGYITPEGTTGVFHADHRPANHLCEGLYEFALLAADDEDIDIPAKIKAQKGLIITLVNVELTPDETMGMMMPSVKPISLDVEHLKTLIAKVQD